MQQHAKAIDDAEILRLGLLQESGLQWNVDDVGNDAVWAG